MRRGLEKMHIRDTFHPMARDDGMVILLVVCHTMSSKEKDMFCKFLHNLEVSDAYSSIYVDV